VNLAAEDGCSVPAGWVDAITRGLASMHADPARIVVTANFAHVVAELTGKRSYTTERGSGAAAAKTVTGPSGSVIVVNYSELSSRPLADIQRLIAHEAGHVLIDARGTEETSGNRDPDEADWQWLLKCLGAQAIVEFRIERSLADLGYPAAELTSAVENSLLVTNVEVVRAVTDPASEDPGHLHDALFTTLNHATKMLGCIAGPLVAGQPGFAPSQLSAEGQANWADYFAPTWDQRLRLWNPIPPATEPIPVESWRTILRRSADLERSLLRSFGFAFEKGPGGDGFYRKADDDVFTRRLNRARAQLGALPG
jgi:hypothetical protein